MASLSSDDNVPDMDMPPPPPLPQEPVANTAAPPPLPASLPPEPQPPLPSSPPPSIQMSNVSSQGLDFDPDVGGLERQDSAAPFGAGRKSKRSQEDGAEEPANKAPKLFTGFEEHQDSDDMEPGEIREENAAAAAAAPSIKISCPFGKQDFATIKQESPQAMLSSPEPLASSVKIEQSRTVELGGIDSEFQIIDDVGEDDANDYGDEEDDDEEDSEGEFVVDEEEIDAMLDQGIQGEYKNFRAPTKKQKIILKELGRDPFDILPEDWVTITHNSGMPVYLHRHTRVCTLSRPYFLGPGSARKHDIPLSAIPCLQYRRAREHLTQQQEAGAADDSCQNGQDGALSSDNAHIPTKDLTANTTVSTDAQVPLTDQSDKAKVFSASEPSANQEPDLTTASQSKTAIESADGVMPPTDQSKSAIKSCDKLASGDHTVGAMEVDVNSEAANQKGNGSDSAVMTGGQLNLKDLLNKTGLAAKVATVNGTAESKEVLSAKPVRIETAEESQKKNSLDPLELRKYCSGLFDFKAITVKRYKTWKDRRRHNSILKKTARPTLPSNTKLITCPIYPDKDEAEKPNRKKEFVLNPHGKSDICILHEYVQHALRQQPRYIYNEIDNAGLPYSATVAIGSVEYGIGYGNSKKSAKSEAARKTLTILIPDFDAIRAEEDKKTVESQDLSFFDQVNIEDPRVSDLSARAGQPKPFSILSECLKRNYGMGNTQIVMQMKTLKHQKGEFTMKVGKHEAKVICKNKRDGKQQAAQAVLQKIHPNIHSWGSLLRLYGTASTEKRKKVDEDGMDCNDSERELSDTSVLEEDVVIIYNPTRKPQSSVQLVDAATDLHQMISGVNAAIQTETETQHAATSPDILVGKIPFATGPKARMEDASTEVDLGGFPATCNLEHTSNIVCRLHRATQAEWVGRDLFHKATQCPEKGYTEGSIRMPSQVPIVKVRNVPQYYYPAFVAQPQPGFLSANGLMVKPSRQSRINPPSLAAGSVAQSSRTPSENSSSAEESSDNTISTEENLPPSDASSTSTTTTPASSTAVAPSAMSYPFQGGLGTYPVALGTGAGSTPQYTAQQLQGQPYMFTNMSYYPNACKGGNVEGTTVQAAEEQSVTGLQVKSKSQKPVDSILAKLRSEMTKLHDVRNAFKSTVTGKLQLDSNTVSLSTNPGGIDL